MKGASRWKTKPFRRQYLMRQKMNAQHGLPLQLWTMTLKRRLARLSQVLAVMEVFILNNSITFCVRSLTFQPPAGLNE